MVYLNFIFYCFVILFAVIGAMRGWAKEMMVTASAVLALFIITVLETYVKGISQSFAEPGTSNQFLMRVAIIIILTFFGYQTPNLPRLGGDRFVRERFQDSLLGIFLGALNGYLVVGSIWYFLSQANYQALSYIIPPDPNTVPGQAAIKLLAFMAPAWLGVPMIYFAVALSFIFVVVVFL
ncbi:MAG: CvpA family protein [Anaerolineales bacterium]